MKKHVFAASALLALTVSQPAVADDGWDFTIAPYLWAAGVEGSSGLGGLPPQDLDLSFGDVLDNLELSFAFYSEMRRDKLSFSLDYFLADLGNSVAIPNAVAADTIDVSSKTQFATLLAGYEIVNDGTTRADVVGGARIWDVQTTFDFNGGNLAGQSAGDGDTWVDPMLGLRFRHALNSNLYLSGWGMLGGFGVGSDLSWDVMVGVGYQYSDLISFYGGYRATGVDYSKDGFVWDAVQQGPILSVTFRF